MLAHYPVLGACGSLVYVVKLSDHTLLVSKCKDMILSQFVSLHSLQVLQVSFHSEGLAEFQNVA